MRALRLLLVLAGLGAGLLLAELALRLHPPEELPLNDPYRFTALPGTRQFGVPFHAYRETYPLAFDTHGYYARSAGAVDYQFDQAGGRWVDARARDLDGRVALVVGDSFTLGFGLRYADAWPYRLEQALQAAGADRHFVNLAQPGADTRASLRTYLAAADQVAHDLVLYGLHLNDLVSFPTSYVVGEPARTRAPWRSHLLELVARRLERRRERAARVAHLVDPAQFDKPLFRDNLAAIEALQRESARRGAHFVVVLLPILVDLQADTFDPVYARIRAALAARGIACIDLTHALPGSRDAAYWILPFDQHPNAEANAAFARAVAEALAPGVIPPR